MRQHAAGLITLLGLFNLLSALAPPERLRQLLADELSGVRRSDKPILLPCCYDGLSARMIAMEGFEAVRNTRWKASTGRRCLLATRAPMQSSFSRPIHRTDIHDGVWSIGC